MTADVCVDIRSLFSVYLDGAVTGQQMREIAFHLDYCSACAKDFDDARLIQETLANLRPVKAPSDLGMKLRLAISREQSRSSANWMDTVGTRWDNAIRPMILQLSAGLAGAVFLVGSVMLLIGIVAVPEPVMANDEPLGALTVPHYLYSAARPRPILTDHDSTIIVEVSVNDRGQVYDYWIVSGPKDAAVQNQVLDQLLESVFEPARVFGGPVRGRAVLTFAGISVHA